MTRGTRLLSYMGALLLAIFVIAGASHAQALTPPERLVGPAHPSSTSSLLQAVTILQSGVGLAGDHAEIKLEGPRSTQTGEEFSVTVRVTEATDLYGLQLGLSVDPTKFKILSVTPGTLFGAQPIYQVGPSVSASGDSLSYALTLLGSTAIPFSGDGVLAVVKLQALAAGGQVIQVWSTASSTLGSPTATLIPSVVTAAPLLVGSPINGLALSVGQPLFDMRVALIQLATGYEVDVAYTKEDGAFVLGAPADGSYLIRINEIPFLPAAVDVAVIDGTPSVQELVMDLTYGDWDGDGQITKVDLDRFATLYYGEELFESEAWIDVARDGASQNRFDLRDLYYVAYNHGMTTPEEVSVGWVYGTVSNMGSIRIPGAAIDVHTLDGLLVDSHVADQEGFYTIALPAGEYRVTFAPAGYESLTRAITVNPLGYLQLFAVLPSPSVALVTPIQVDLSWNSVGDMDSWLLVPGAVGFSAGQVMTKVSGVGAQGLSTAHPWAVHTGDVVHPSGTESVLIHRLVPGTYQFWAQKAVGDLTVAMDTSITITGGTHSAQTISLAGATGSGYQWKVFTLTVAENGTYQITSINTLHDPFDLDGFGLSTVDSKR